LKCSAYLATQKQGVLVRWQTECRTARKRRKQNAKKSKNLFVHG
jgi:hypothetical protein